MLGLIYGAFERGRANRLGSATGRRDHHRLAEHFVEERGDRWSWMHDGCHQEDREVFKFCRFQHVLYLLCSALVLRYSFIDAVRQAHEVCAKPSSGSWINNPVGDELAPFHY